MEEVDLVITNASELLTLRNEGPKRGGQLDRLDMISGGAVAVRGEEIAALGAAKAVERKYSAKETIDAGGCVVMPGFVDPHTHPIFGATREREFDMRIRGKTYMEITQAGGGIFSSVRSLRETPENELEDLVRRRFDAFIALGTTTIEAKSGYGLNREDEIRSLEILRRVGESHPLEAVPTFLGAHHVPEEYASNREEYISRLIGEIMPEVRRRGLAEYCDVFCEEGVFDIAESRRIMTAARDLGFGLRFHADELAPFGGAELAAELGAASADHLVMVSDSGLEALGRAGTIPVVLPGTVFSLDLERKTRAREMIDRGLPVALATDFNPGTSFVQSMATVINIACCALRMTVAEAVGAATVNAAWSLGRGGAIGSLEAGRQADIIVLDCPNHLFLGYRLGWNPVKVVVKKGRIVYRRPSSLEID